MKRKIISFLMVALIVATMSIPVFASGSTVVLNGVEFPSLPETGKNYVVVETSNLYQYTVTVFDTYSYLELSASEILFRAENAIQFRLTGTEWKKAEDGVGIVINSPFWSNHDLLNKDGSVWFVGSVLTCDGSSCPAIDANFDWHCDECGLRIFNLQRTPVPPEFTGNNFNYALGRLPEGFLYVALYYDEEYEVTGSIYGANYRISASPNAYAKTYGSVDGINWIEKSTQLIGNIYPGTTEGTILASSFDWYDADGNRFFPVPLWEAVQTVTQGAVTEEQTNLGRTITILVLCGVGCLAFLIILKLFGKRSLIYRN